MPIQWQMLSFPKWGHIEYNRDDIDLWEFEVILCSFPLIK